MDNSERLNMLKTIAKGIAMHFGEKCEVVVYDLTKDYEHTIVAIENGYISGRQIGDFASNIVLELLKSFNENNNSEEIKDKYNYLTQTKDGRILKSSSIFIKDSNGKICSMLGINYDITDFLTAESIISSFTNSSAKKEVKEIIPSSVNDLLDILVNEAYEYIGKPVASMTKEDKIKAVKYLEQKGAFLIKKSGDKISNFFDISKYTLYNYLSNEIKE